MVKVSTPIRKFAFAAAAACLFVSGTVQAQARSTAEYPTHTIKVVVPYPASGAADALGCPIGTKLAAHGDSR